MEEMRVFLILFIFVPRLYWMLPCLQPRKRRLVQVSINAPWDDSFQIQRDSVSSQLPHLAMHTRPPIKKNKTLEDHILLEPYVLSNESRIQIAFKVKVLYVGWRGLVQRVSPTLQRTNPRHKALVVRSK